VSQLGAPNQPPLPRRSKVRRELAETPAVAWWRYKAGISKRPR